MENYSPLNTSVIDKKEQTNYNIKYNIFRLQVEEFLLQSTCCIQFTSKVLRVEEVVC